MRFLIPLTSFQVSFGCDRWTGLHFQIHKRPCWSRQPQPGGFARWRKSLYRHVSPGWAGWERIAYLFCLAQRPWRALEAWAVKRAGLARLDLLTGMAGDAVQHCRARQVQDFRTMSEAEFSRLRQDQEALVERIKLELQDQQYPQAGG